ncbi:MAG: GTP 3',8-cyclase MoaA [Bacillota bacterium]
MAIQASCQREIDYLRISITDRCNLRCRYCMPPEGVTYKEHEEIMRYEEIVKFVKVAASHGISRLRITGGEPLVRLDVPDLIEKLSSISGIEEITMTTNGYYLLEQAESLVQAGLNRINISLDSLNEEKFKHITGTAGLARVLKGLNKARLIGLDPIKINMVVIKGTNDDEIIDFIKFAQAHNYHLRFIEYMPLSGEESNNDKYISLDEIKERIISAGYNLEVESRIKGSGPAANYRLNGGGTTIGFISPISHNFCASCNRLRLTSDGKLRPCLAIDEEYNLYDEAGQLLPEQEIEAVLLTACQKKPVQHNFANAEDHGRNMSQIGG